MSEARTGPTAFARGDDLATTAVTVTRWHRLVHAALFVALLGALVWIYDYAAVARVGPISVHAWRQADAASLALNYYEHGMRFFEPRVHNVLGEM